MKQVITKIKNPLLLATFLVAGSIAGATAGSIAGQITQHQAMGILAGLVLGLVLGVMFYKNRHELSVLSPKSSRPESP